jgi:hypothetical protein
MMAAQQPLLVEELIEACTVRLDTGGQVHEGLRLSPADIVLLLRHLVAVEKAETATDLTSTAVSTKDYLVFAHFSVREHLITDTETLEQGSATELEQAHLHVASSCIAYLLRTNTRDKRKDEYPLRQYAWDHWAMHAVASKTYTPTETSKHAQDLYEKVAFGSGHDIPEDLQRIIWWTDSKRALLDCLRNPYFFEEYDASELEPQMNGFRFLHIIPSRNPFGVVRLGTMHSPPDARRENEAVFFHFFAIISTKHIWLNGHRRQVHARTEAALRAMQEPSSHNRPFLVGCNPN